MKKTLVTLVLLSSAAFAAEPPKAGGPGNAAGQGQGQGQGEQRQRPDPAQMATQMMSRFDANKDSILSQEELKLALEDMHKNRPQRPDQAGQSEQRPEPPSADKVAPQMLERFSADKKGLTADELTKALEERPRQGGNRGDRQPRNDQNTK